MKPAPSLARKATTLATSPRSDLRKLTARSSGVPVLSVESGLQRYARCQMVAAAHTCFAGSAWKGRTDRLKAAYGRGMVSIPFKQLRRGEAHLRVTSLFAGSREATVFGPQTHHWSPWTETLGQGGAWNPIPTELAIQLPHSAQYDTRHISGCIG